MFNRHTNTSVKQDELAHQCLVGIQIINVKLDELAHQCLIDILTLVENKINWLINV